MFCFVDKIIYLIVALWAHFTFEAKTTHRLSKHLHFGIFFTIFPSILHEFAWNWFDKCSTFVCCKMWILHNYSNIFSNWTHTEEESKTAYKQTNAFILDWNRICCNKQISIKISHKLFIVIAIEIPKTSKVQIECVPNWNTFCLNAWNLNMLTDKIVISFARFCALAQPIFQAVNLLQAVYFNWNEIQMEILSQHCRVHISWMFATSRSKIK